MMKLRLVIFELLFFLLGIAFAFSFPPLSFAQTGEDDDTEVVKIRRGDTEIQSTVIKETPDPKSGKPSRTGSILVKFKKSAGLGVLDKIIKKVGAKKSDKLFLDWTYRLRVHKNSVGLALFLLSNDPYVEYAVADQVMYALYVPNDPSFGQQWGMAKINAPSAWEITTSTGVVRVAILDCGVYDSASNYIAPDGQRGHPDIRNKVINRKNFTTSSNTDDFCNHGTHVAGIAASHTNNGIGVASSGYQASIVNVKVLGDNGSGTFGWIINGILWAAGCDTNPCGPRRAEIINMSLGAQTSCDPLVQAAIDKAWSQGMVITAAAGNSNRSGAITPANCNNVIGVSASDQNDAKASFSNYGYGTDVAAPGVGILSTNYVGGYSSFSGTSMASPHVAGLAALIWTTTHNTGNAGVVSRIFDTAKAEAKAGSTYGRIDAFASVLSALIQQTPTPLPSATPTPTPTPTPIPVSSATPTPTSTPLLTATPTPTLSPTLAPPPVSESCTAPIVLSHSDSSPTGSGTVTFSWTPVSGASQYRVQTQRTFGSWYTRATSSANSFTGSDSYYDPNWRVFVYAGSCTPVPGPATVFDP